jgi:excisionase family DNA binding protein
MSRPPAPHVETPTPVARAEPPLLLTPEQAFALLQVGRTHGWRLINSGAIPSVRLSERVVRVPRAALEERIAARGVQSARATQVEPLKIHERVG